MKLQNIDADHHSLRLCEGSDTLVVSFEGIRLTEWIWPEVASRYDLHWLNLHDPEDRYAFPGIAGFSNDVEDTSAKIIDIAEALAVERLVVLGYSSGATSAIIHGYLTEADHVLAINPRILADAATRKRMGDVRRTSATDDTLAHPLCFPEYRDFNTLFAASVGTTYDIYYSALHRADKLLQQYVRDYDCVTYYPMQESRHALWKVMMRDNAFYPVVEKAIFP